MSPHLLAELAHDNLAEALRLQVRSSLGARMLEFEESLLAFGSTRFPAAPFNALLRAGRNAPAASVLEFAEEAFARQQRGFSVYAQQTRDSDLAEACQRRGYQASGELGLLCAERAPELPSTQLSIEIVSDAAGVKGFAELAADGFSRVGLPESVALGAFSSPEALLAPDLRLLLVHADGGPAACALLLPSNGIAGIYWVGTRSSAQRRGLASACITEAMRHAFESGAAAVVLQAAPVLEPFYARLGFRRLAALRLFSWLTRTRRSGTSERNCS